MKLACSITLRPYQERLIAAIRAAFAAGFISVMAVASTGAGKTVCFSYIAAHAAMLGHTTFILVHRKELIRQTSKSLRKNGIPHGVIASGYPPTNHPIQVCSIQSLANRLDRYHEPDLLVIDEGHHLMAKNYLKVIEWAKAGGAHILPVTATPHRADGQGFNTVVETMVEADDINTLINDGWLVKPNYFAPPIEEIENNPGLIREGKFVDSDLEGKRDTKTITGKAVEHYLKILPHMPPTIVFCVSVKHAKNVADEFTLEGVPSEAIDGTMTDDEREAIIARVERGETKCLMSCDLVSEGFDLPAMVCAIMLRDIGPNCLALCMQQWGRVLRPAEGKTEAYIMDHVNNWKRHGFVEEKRDWWESFYGRQKKSKKEGGAETGRCPKCYCVFPPAPICPSCGHDMRAKATGNGGGREIEQVDGELVKFDTTAMLQYKQNTGRGMKQAEITKLKRA